MSNSCFIPDQSTPVNTLYHGHWLTLKQRGRWEYAERNNPGGAVIILAVTDNDDLLFVEQFRVPIMQHTIEMPAGLVGDIKGLEDESFLLAAKRELEEETGYRAETVTFLHQGPSSAGLSNETMHFVHARQLKKVSSGGGDDSEDIRVHEVPRKHAGAWLIAKSHQGLSIDPKLFAGLWLLENEQLFTTDPAAR